MNNFNQHNENYTNEGKDVFLASTQILNENGLTKCYFHDSKIHGLIPTHRHNFHEINIVISGKISHVINDKVFEAHQGDVFVIPPNLNHSYICEGDFVVFHAILSSEFIKRYKRELSILPGYTLLFSIEPFIRTQYSESLFLHLRGSEYDNAYSIMRKLVSIEETPDSQLVEKCIMQDSLVLYFIAFLSHYIYSEYSFETNQIKDTSASVSILNCLRYINENYNQKIMIDDLCSLCNMSRSTLYRYFADMCSMSPYEYQLKCRIDAAKQMLSTTDSSILDIAISCGFFDSSHFIRVFIKEVGMSPRQYSQTRRTENNLERQKRFNNN